VKNVEGKKSARLRKNKVTPNDIHKITEATSTPKANSKRKPHISDQVENVKSLEVPTVETTEVPEVQVSRLGEIKNAEVSEIQTNEVQKTSSKIQEKATEQTEGEETLDLIETIDQDLDIRSEAFLEADPLYREYKAAQVPKYQRLDVKLYVLLRDDQLEFLARLTRQIMKNRTSEYKIERITKNTIIRALIDNLKELELDVRNIPDETELAKRIADSIGSLTSLTGGRAT
jgi:hypothetical protein